MRRPPDPPGGASDRPPERDTHADSLDATDDARSLSGSVARIADSRVFDLRGDSGAPRRGPSSQARDLR